MGRREYRWLAAGRTRQNPTRAQRGAGTLKLPSVALVTNLAPNHLDRHGTLGAYALAKQNIFRFQGPDDVLILNRRCELTRHWATQAPGKVEWFDAEDPQFDLALPGGHNQANAQAAWAIARTLGIQRVQAQQKLREFRGLPHRTEVVAPRASTSG